MSGYNKSVYQIGEPVYATCPVGSTGVARIQDVDTESFIATGYCGEEIASFDSGNLGIAYKVIYYEDDTFSVTTNEYDVCVKESSTFLGCSDSESVMGSVTEGVTGTTVIYGFIALVGISLAFVIANYLVDFINKSVKTKTERKNRVINQDGEEFIYHDAKTLEFKREYGSNRSDTP